MASGVECIAVTSPCDGVVCDMPMPRAVLPIMLLFGEGRGRRKGGRNMTALRQTNEIAQRIVHPFFLQRSHPWRSIWQGGSLDKSRWLFVTPCFYESLPHVLTRFNVPWRLTELKTTKPGTPTSQTTVKQKTPTHHISHTQQYQELRQWYIASPSLCTLKQSHEALFVTIFGQEPDDDQPNQKPPQSCSGVSLHFC